MRNHLLNSFSVFVVLLLSFITINGIGESYPGHIAIIGTDYNVYTLFDGNEYPLTTDGNQNKVYQWATWSTDGRLAYFCCDLPSALTIDTAAYVSNDGLTTGKEVWASRAEAVIYAAWAPSQCDNDANCRDLAILHNSVAEQTLAVTLIRDNQESSTITEIGTGSPFYFHFSPNGQQMIFHRNNDDVELFSVSQNDVIDLLSNNSIASYQAPAWSPIDGRVLYGIESDSFTTDLIVSEDDTEKTLVTGLTGYVSFLWSPNGRYVAYRTLTRDGYGKVTVVDAQNGETVSQSTENAISFWWAPNSERIAYVSLYTNQGNFSQNSPYLLTKQFVAQQEPSLVWSVLNIETGENRLFNSFYPTYEMGYMMTYFDQFAPSHPIWSPDSRYLVYSQVKDDDSAISILDIDTSGLSVDIADGVFATWSFK